MRMLLNFASWAIVGALSCPTAALADPIRLVAEFRDVGASANLESDSQFSTSSSADALNANVILSNTATTVFAQGLLNSSIAGVTHIFGSGVAMSAINTPGTISAYAVGSANFDVQFELDRSYAFDFTGLFSSSGSPGDTGDTHWSTVLIGVPLGGTPDTTLFNYGGLELTPLSTSGVLPPGRWDIAAHASAANNGLQGTGTSNAWYTFRFDLSPVGEPAPVPEPTSLILIATGLLGVVHARRRRENMWHSHGPRE